MVKLVNLDTRSEYEKLVDKIEYELPTTIKFIQSQSELISAQYNSLIKNGFTKEQALEISIELPLWR